LIGSSSFSFLCCLVVFPFFSLLFGLHEVVVAVQLLALVVFVLFFFFAAFFLRRFDSNLSPFFLIRKEYSSSRGESRAVHVVSREY